MSARPTDPSAFGGLAPANRDPAEGPPADPAPGGDILPSETHLGAAGDPAEGGRDDTEGELLFDGQEEVFSRREVELGLIEHRTLEE